MSHQLSVHFTSKNTILELLTVPQAQGPKTSIGRTVQGPTCSAYQPWRKIDIRNELK